ncbi:IS110 family transposase [Rhodococcus indonesiensis]|uniref:IS110 family transposase n=1 Tax=Rhodococcus indonesiensis TaxID=3055869 RepID=UPI0039F6A3E0
MTSLTDLREVVDVVIGVDTHVHTHSAAAVDARTGGMLDEITVETTADGYAQPVEFADEHATLRAWAVEGTGGHGAGLTRVLERGGQVVIELDRPERAKRRHGAKSDPLDAIRAAREALARPRLGTPRRGGDRRPCRCCRPPAGPRSTPPRTPSANCSVWSSPPPRTFGSGSAVGHCPAWSRSQPACGSAPAGMSRPARPSPRCGPWPAGPVHWPRRPPRTRTPSGRSCGRGGQTTRAYVARRTGEGKSTRDIKRCLKRYIARDLYRLLEQQPIEA